jgi:hypothetical protein
MDFLVYSKGEEFASKTKPCRRAHIVYDVVHYTYHWEINIEKIEEFIDLVREAGTITLERDGSSIMLCILNENKE